MNVLSCVDFPENIAYLVLSGISTHNASDVTQVFQQTGHHFSHSLPLVKR